MLRRNGAPGLQLGFQVWGQHANWVDLMATGHLIDELGFDSLWSNDHFYPAIGGDVEPREGEAGPVFESWMTLAGWAARTRRVRLGCLVSGAGYRNPAVLVKMATALDHATGGRAVLGLGAGWHRSEHVAFGIDFPPVGQRLDRLEDAAAIARPMLAGTSADHVGDWFSTYGARNDPPPVQARLPLLIGGSGERRTLGIVARYADIWNGEGDPASFARKSTVLDDHCRAVGREPREIRRTVGLPPPLIRDDPDRAVAVLADLLIRHGVPPDIARQAAVSPLVGRLDRVVSRLREYREAGADEVMFDWPLPSDEETLRALAPLAQERLNDPPARREIGEPRIQD